MIVSVYYKLLYGELPIFGVMNEKAGFTEHLDWKHITITFTFYSYDFMNATKLKLVTIYFSLFQSVGLLARNNVEDHKTHGISQDATLCDAMMIGCNWMI